MAFFSSQTYPKGVYFLGLFCYSLGPLSLLLIQVFPMASPNIYYVGYSFQGLAEWFGPSFAIMSDLVSPGFRAPAYSLIVLSASSFVPSVPSIAASFSNLIASSLAFGFCVFGLLFGYFFLPETLSPESKRNAVRKREEDNQNQRSLLYTVLRPVKELDVVNRNLLFRLLSSLLLLSAIVKAGERVNLLFYAEGQIGFTEANVATYSLVHSITIIIVQSVGLNSLIQRIGERNVLIVSMFCGMIFSFMYGIAKVPFFIYLGGVFSALSGMDFATISSIMSFNVEKYEQGKIQGVLLSIQAVSNAFGPLFLTYVFDKTVDGAILGAATMFFISVIFYMIALVLAFALPPDQANSKAVAMTDEVFTPLLDEEAN